MTPASAINRALSSLKPGDTYTLPDGDILGNIVLPRGLSGSKGKFITIRGGKDTRIIATDKSKAALNWDCTSSGTWTRRPSSDGSR